MIWEIKRVKRLTDTPFCAIPFPLYPHLARFGWGNLLSTWLSSENLRIAWLHFLYLTAFQVSWEPTQPSSPCWHSHAICREFATLTFCSQLKNSSLRPSFLIIPLSRWWLKPFSVSHRGDFCLLFSFKIRNAFCRQILLRRAPQRFYPCFQLQNATRLITFHFASYLADFDDSSFHNFTAITRLHHLIYHSAFVLHRLKPNDYPLSLNHHCLAWTRKRTLLHFTVSPIGSHGFTDSSFWYISKCFKDHRDSACLIDHFCKWR